ncbi:YbaN family protein [Vibrio sp. SCSIO 43136]|uniref:YbaN family protein n=1 Tax=Vibrio sp. SCSIO 43136 TaxID=2819101 RepID=UPI002189A15B|nr:YbaN family protein [Vibrio sp. SCSIO 43136]USD66629.1 YbaN family protein [Vibrio sp. SCSIO 43136]
MAIKRFFWNTLGAIALILGIIGIPLPVLPTTPFILLASACFMRGSPRFHHWLHSHKTFGPILHNWQQNRAVSAKVKKRAYIFIAISFTFSITVAPIWWVKIMLLAVLVVLITWFSRLPTHDDVAPPNENH